MSLTRFATVLLCLMLALAGCGTGPGGDQTTDGGATPADGAETGAETTAGGGNATAGNATAGNATAGTTTAGTATTGEGTAGAGTNGTATTGNETTTGNATTGNETTTDNATTAPNGTGSASLDTAALADSHEQAVRDGGSVTVVVNTTTESNRGRFSANASDQIDLKNDTSYQQNVAERSAANGSEPESTETADSGTPGMGTPATPMTPEAPEVPGATTGNTSMVAESDQSPTSQRLDVYSADNRTYLRAVADDGEPNYQVVDDSMGRSAVDTATEEFVTLQSAFLVIEATTWTASSNTTGNDSGSTTYTAEGVDALDTDALFEQDASNASDGTPTEQNASGSSPFEVDATDYTATLVVGEDGTVERLTYTLVVDVGGEPITLTRSYEVSDIGTTTVEEPSWVDQARQEAGGDGSTTGNETNTTSTPTPMA